VICLGLCGTCLGCVWDFFEVYVGTLRGCSGFGVAQNLASCWGGMTCVAMSSVFSNFARDVWYVFVTVWDCFGTCWDFLGTVLGLVGTFWDFF